MKTHCVGQSLVEVIVAVGIVLIIVTGLVVATTFSLRFNQNSKMRTEALSFAKEGMERMRALRDTGWDTVPSSGAYCLDIGETELTSEPAGGCALDGETGFRRVIRVSMDESCQDPAVCRKVTIQVSWLEGDSGQDVELSSYITNWRSRQ